MHPVRQDFIQYFGAIGGSSFDTVVARPIALRQMPRFLPQIRLRRALRGYLSESMYGIRAGEIVKTQRVVHAAEVREIVGLSESQEIILLLFDDDPILERLFDPHILRELSGAGYDLVVSPSFSAWEPRPRMEIMYNAKRSLVIYDALQELGVPALPRVVWSTDRDAERWAEWLTDNPAVTYVAIDSMTYRGRGGWRRLLDGLRRVDQLTSGMFRYLINGPSTEERFVELARIVSLGRLHLTNAQVMAAPPSQEEKKRFGAFSGDKSGVRFGGRVEAQRATLARVESRWRKAA